MNPHVILARISMNETGNRALVLGPKERPRALGAGGAKHQMKRALGVDGAPELSPAETEGSAMFFSGRVVLAEIEASLFH